MDADDQESIRVRSRRRVAAACAKCKQQKLKCSGTIPCTRCTRRGIPCLESERQRVSISYVRDLQRQVAEAGRTRERSELPRQTQTTSPLSIRGQSPTRQSSSIDEDERPATGSSHINALAMGQSVYVSDSRGRAIWLGTSSNWSFGRRVLLISYERVMNSPLPIEDLLWPGKVYDIGWDGRRATLHNSENEVVLPHADHAIYLINTVKFFCAQIFHLYDETNFMRKFRAFHESKSTDESSLWFNHYLLLLAFGKAFVARESKGNLPPGCDLFMKAMSTLPDLSFADPDPLEAMEVLCCASLYLHSLDFRAAAYRLIGQALRMALEQGLHTDMNDRHISDDTLQRARQIWWTIHLLDRQMSALQGTPMAVRDEDITAGLPSFSGQASRVRSLKLHAKLSSLMAAVVTNIYGKEGRLDDKFMWHTKTALKDISTITDDLKSEFPLHKSDVSNGISRVSAFLHLLHHQCVVLATRPVLFNILQSRLARQDKTPQPTALTSSINALLQMCTDSAMQMVKILVSLQQQGLLESFLTFDLDAVYSSAMIILMAAHLDKPTIENYRAWLTAEYGIMDEMESRGNQIARCLRSELQQMEGALSRLPGKTNAGQPVPPAVLGAQQGNELEEGEHTMLDDGMLGTMNGEMTIEGESIEEWLRNGPGPAMNINFDAEQMALVADAIDPDRANWWFDQILPTLDQS